MQTLGLSSKPQPTDNLFKRLFWPTIESQYDVDLLGQQGFWVCTVVAVLSAIMLFPSMPVVGIATAIIFFLGGCGVRQRSIAASISVCLLYLVNFIGNFIGGIILGSAGNPLIQLAILMLLFANVRATILSRRWFSQNLGDHELPERLTDSLTDKFSNKLPTKLWPIGRYIFFPLTGIVLLLTIAGFVMLSRMPRRYHPNPTSQQIDAAPPR